MKKVSAILLVFATVFALCACGATPTTETTPPTQSAEEQAILRVLTIGNSHTLDTNQFLAYIFQQEMPQQKVMLGNMYHPGCTLKQHLTFALGDGAEYDYHRNIDGFWTQTNDVTLSYALGEQQWDIIVLHDLNAETGKDTAFADNPFPKFMDYLLSHTDGSPTFIWNLSWSNPTDEDILSPMHHLPPPDGWRDNYKNLYNLDYDLLFEKLSQNTQKHIMTHEKITTAIPTGTAFAYARNVLGKTDKDLYRDNTHASDYGALLAGYVWYATLTGQTALSEIHITSVPAKLRNHNFVKDGDLILTEQDQKDILAAVNYALENPWATPKEN